MVFLGPDAEGLLDEVSGAVRVPGEGESEAVEGLVVLIYEGFEFVHGLVVVRVFIGWIIPEFFW